MSIKRGTITIREHMVSTSRVYGYAVQCGACGPEVESLPRAMPNGALAQLRGPRSMTDVPINAHRDGGDGRPWLIITGNDANGGNISPFVRCGACRGDRDQTHEG